MYTCPPTYFRKPTQPNFTQKDFCEETGKQAHKAVLLGAGKLAAMHASKSQQADWPSGPMHGMQNKIKVYAWLKVPILLMGSGRWHSVHICAFIEI